MNARMPLDPKQVQCVECGTVFTVPSWVDTSELEAVCESCEQDPIAPVSPIAEPPFTLNLGQAVAYAREHTTVLEAIFGKR